jgi:pSer/pThr/pTyr-binding forkhead associated (FHA) protein
MGDSCLNSVHLEPNRRQHFRSARDGLLNARGSQTVALQRQDLAFFQRGSPNPPSLPAPTSDYWLSDGRNSYPLKVGINTIGRSADCDVVVTNGYISRRHCAILVHAGDHRCEVHDIASKNGTFLNGSRVGSPASLHAGDELRMCDMHFVLLSKLEGENSPSPSMTQLDPHS